MKQATRQHWEHVYRSTDLESASWFEQLPKRSLDFIARAGAGEEAEIIDVGGGDSRLVDALLGLAERHLTVVDISAAALAQAQSRLGHRAEKVTWVEADITRADLPVAAFDIWHDRALFHFLADAADRIRYVRAAERSLKPGGHLIIATFAPDGPTRCSGLDVVRYSAELLEGEFGPQFELIDSVRDVHRTPAGRDQPFTYCLFRKKNDNDSYPLQAASVL